MNILEKILVVPDIELNYNLCPGGQGGFGYIQLNNLGVSIENQKVDKIKMRLNNAKGMKRAWALGKYKDVDFNTSGFLGKKHSLKTKKKISKGALKRTGNKNGSFGTCWITNDIETKKIKKNDLDNYLEIGYHKGRN
jgi:hypothetical protein